ncbi:hypothetical protein D5S18_27820 [Nocardia panacis]|uniref:Solute-binding protein family 3/N-terminal domain-containing protein n=1 Tax=Nocardia panacis TaxID=2340916 RepID=A0A3A4K0Y5_9NOCA|nr:transporter substrate-binding domain-containing protein [Nocardia panacis]RJO70983.1 hypothetical protein D5S18_27820 [Nocardia panacis]
MQFRVPISLAAAALALGLTAATAHADTTRLLTVRAAGTLRVCTTGDYPPYTVREADGSYRGIDITLATELAATLGVSPQWVPVTWAALTEDFAARCDIAVGGISDTAARRQTVDFSVPLSTDGKTPVSRRADGDAYATVEQINRPGVRVIVNRGGTNEAFARANFPAADLTLWPDNLTIYDEIEQGRADVFVTDSAEGRYRQQTHPTLRVLHPDAPFDSFTKAYALPRGDAPFAAVVNTWLAVQSRTGHVERLTEDWIGAQ